MMWKQCENEQELLVQMRRELHKIPELEHTLPKTLAYIREQLELYGINYRCSKLDGSIIAEIVGNSKGKTIVLRADVDALPIEEANDIPYKSQHAGCMHACGHDAHGAILLGAVKVLNEHKNELNGTVRFLFQTAEEIAKGAEIMVADHALDNADAIFGLHIGSLFGKEIPSGTIISSPGCCMASMDKFIIHVNGMGCHGSTPEKGIDPINIASHIVISLQTIIAREFSATSPVVLTIGKIMGGDAFNIIPNMVTLEGTIRAVNQADRQRIIDRISEISNQIALAFGGSTTVEIISGSPPVINDKEMACLGADAATEIVGENYVIRSLESPNMVGEDFAFYLEKIPGAFMILSSSNIKCGSDIPHHNPNFQIDESVLWKGSALFVSIVEKFLQ